MWENDEMYLDVIVVVIGYNYIRRKLDYDKYFGHVYDHDMQKSMKSLNRNYYTVHNYDSHRNEMSPLTHGVNYRSACD